MLKSNARPLAHTVTARRTAGSADGLADALDVVDHPDEVSICATRIDLTFRALSSFSRASTSAGRTARSHSPLRASTSAPRNAAALPQPTANRPLSSTRTLSPLERTLVTAAPPAPWPFALYRYALPPILTHPPLSP